MRVSPGSPSQWYAIRSPSPAATWRSRQLALTFSLPPMNHLAYGGSHAYSSVHGSIQSSRFPSAAQNSRKPSSLAARS